MGNPHFMVDPIIAKAVAQHIAQAFAAVDPANPYGAALPWPEPPHLVLWHAQTVLQPLGVAICMIGFSSFRGKQPVVYCGSSNLAQGGEESNGDNLLDEEIAPGDAVEVTFEGGIFSSPKASKTATIAEVALEANDLAAAGGGSHRTVPRIVARLTATPVSARASARPREWPPRKKPIARPRRDRHGGRARRPMAPRRRRRRRGWERTGRSSGSR